MEEEEEQGGGCGNKHGVGEEMDMAMLEKDIEGPMQDEEIR